MAISADLVIEDKTFKVHHFYISVDRTCANNGKPLTPPVWRMDLTLEITDDTKLTEWALSPTKTYDGRLDVFSSGADGTMKKYEFKGALCYTLIDLVIPSLTEASCYLMIQGTDLNLGSATVSIEQMYR